MITKDLRHRRILELLEERGTISPKNLASLVSVSEMTIRRDIRELYDRKMIETFYGGVSLPPKPHAEIPQHKSLDIYHTEQEQHLQEKLRIAKYASQLVESQDVICIDNGTTCCHISDFFTSDTNCLVYSYSQRTLAKIMQLKNENIQLFALGGYYHSQLQMYEHSGIIDVIKKLHINKMFMGAVGVSLEGDLSCVQPYEVPVRKALMEQSDEVILPADSSKIGKSWYDKYGVLKDLSVFITDSGITIEQKETLENLGVNLVIV